MPQLSPLEILVVAAVALIVFGPEKLPDIARTVGGAAARMRRMAAEFREEFETSLTVDDEDDFDTDDDEVVPRNRPPARGSHRPQAGPRTSRPGADPEDDSVPEPFATFPDDPTSEAPDEDVVPPAAGDRDDDGGHPPTTTPER